MAKAAADKNRGVEHEGLEIWGEELGLEADSDQTPAVAPAGRDRDEEELVV